MAAQNATPPKDSYYKYVVVMLCPILSIAPFHDNPQEPQYAPRLVYETSPFKRQTQAPGRSLNCPQPVLCTRLLHCACVSLPLLSSKRHPSSSTPLIVGDQHV